MLEAGRRDELQDPRRGVSRIPERVPLVTGLEHQVADLGDEDLIAEQCPDLALQDVGVLVLSVVLVQRSRERARRHRMLDQGEAAVGVLAVAHAPASDDSEKSSPSIPGANNLRLRCLHDSFSFLNGQPCRANIYTGLSDLSRLIEQICPTKSVHTERSAEPSSRRRPGGGSPRAPSSCTGRSVPPAPR